MRGAAYMRMGRFSQTSEDIDRLLDAVSRSLKVLCISSFGSELLAACGAAGFRLKLREMVRGPNSPGETRRLRGEGGYAIPAGVVINGMSMFPALLMNPVELPPENSMAKYLCWLADQLRAEQILLWCDTGDMRADPMTKGTISRYWT